MYEIEIANHQQSLAIDEVFVRQVVRRTLEIEQVASASISVAIVDNAQIHELNRQYLNHDYETDVLSFLLEEAIDSSMDKSGDQPRGAGKTIDGEIIISTEMAIERATDYAWESMDELTLYIVHGLLHLCGYDDLSGDELPVMRERECFVFEMLGRPRPSRDRSDCGHVDEERSSSGSTEMNETRGLS
ncbi:MAG: rRNA maturation RNase YbeY [Planctomycetota bacterium]|nr:rRNA maturation RNase YbeY [Planctomycetota bacterium]MDA1162710.1 rRNA maturation RNase YbeY [Planctomycetota bacterium]